MSKKCTVVIDNEINCRIAGLAPQDLTSLWDKFGFYAEGYRWMPKFQLGQWDGKIRFFDKNGKTFTKMLDEIIPYLASWNYDVDLRDDRIPVKVISDRVTSDYFDNIKEYEDGEERIVLRPYQVDSVNEVLEEGSGFIIAGTGAGKTLICAAIASVLEQNDIQTMIIVPSSDLVTQTRDELVKCGLQVGEYSGETKNIDEKIVVGTWQALQNAPYHMLQFQAVIVDEAHGTKATVIRELINDNGGHIAYRFGVTGTFPKPITDQYALRTSIGRIVKEIPAKWLIDNGYLSEVEIEPIMIHEKPGYEDFPDYSSERAYVSKNSERLEKIAEIIQEKQKQYGNTLVLTASIPQGRQLEEMIPGSIFLYGESEKELRAQNYKQYAERDDVIVIASSGIASTGISIDRIFCLVLVDTGKSFVRAIQSVGRSLRKKGDKNKSHVVDVYSSLKWCKKHWNERKKYYKEAGYPTWDVEKVKY
jgi:superfamily II DNA or RNA helicase